MFLQWFYSPSPWDVLTRASRSVCSPLTRIAKQDRGETAISVSFDAGVVRDDASPAEQETFAAEFKRELARVMSWFVRENWTPSLLPDLQVFVSGDYKISRALVPAWEGRRGRIEFPAWRVSTGKAAIVHELTHVYFPNGNRFLAEGFAIYLQAELGGNLAFPNFGRPLHDLARDHLQEMAPGFLSDGVAALTDSLLAELDAIPTPNPLALKAAVRCYDSEPRVQAAIYAIAGSFVQFLIEAHGLVKFRALYLDTPLFAGRLEAGRPTRWMRVYDHSLAALEAEWKSLIADADSAPVAEMMIRPSHANFKEEHKDA
jgi:hypothetical protein